MNWKEQLASGKMEYSKRAEELSCPEIALHNCKAKWEKDMMII